MPLDDGSLVWLKHPERVRVFACEYRTVSGDASMEDGWEDVSHLLTNDQRERLGQRLLLKKEDLGEFPVIAASLTRTSMVVWVEVDGEVRGISRTGVRPPFLYTVTKWRTLL